VEIKMKKLALLAVVGVLAGTPALAQGHAGMPGTDMAPMQGQHMMPVTITAIDSKTGLVDAIAGSMALKLHFPPPSLAGVKAGDKIMVHLAFHKS